MTDPVPGDDGLRLLALDGGGVRGLSSIKILRRIMQGVNEGRPAKDQLKVAQIVDVIGGTGTGGLLAIFLGRLGMDVEDCFTHFSRVFELVFRGVDLPTQAEVANWKGDIRPVFDSVRLKKILTDIVTGCGLAPDAKLNDGEHRDCHTFVCVSPVETSNVCIFRDYDKPGIERPLHRPTIVQAALATLATVNFFDQVTIGHETYASADLGASNPVDQVWFEAEDLWNDTDKSGFEDKIANVVSVGTGHPGITPIHYKTIKFYGETMVKIAQYTEQKDGEFKHTHRSLVKPTDQRFYRLNVQQGLQNIGPEEYKFHGSINICTEEYLDDRELRFKVKGITKNWRQKKCGRHDLIDAKELLNFH